MDASRAFARNLYRVALAILISANLAFFPAFASHGKAAANVVGSGTAGSCTEAAFDNVFFAVQAAGGTITFNCGAAPVVILFSAPKSVAANTTLEGGGRITISGANAAGLFQVFSGQTLTLNQITLTRALSISGAVENFGTLNVTNSQITNSSSSLSGGGILNHGTLNLTNAVISGNSTAQYGGGIYSDSGTVTITNSQVTGNTAGQGGGGVAAGGDTNLVVSASHFSGNRATDTFAQGGALVNVEVTAKTQVTGSTFFQNSSSRGGAVSVLDGTVNITQSVFTGNWSAYGGGIRQEGGTLTLDRVKLTGNGYSPTGTRVNTGGGALSWGNGTATLTNVTISNNWASYGGGFDHENGITTLTNVTISGNQAVGSGGFDMAGGTVTLVNTTIANNSAGFFGGGIGNRNGTVVLKNTLVSGNFNSDTKASWNCNKSIGSTPFTLSSDFTCGLGAGRDGINAFLGLLQDVNPFTQVHLVLKGSPAIDTGTGVGCPSVDQRGIARPQGTACDIGAVEVTQNDLQSRVYLPFTRR